MASRRRTVRKYKRAGGTRQKKHGFFKRMDTPQGRAILAARRKKGRKSLTPQQQKK